MSTLLRTSGLALVFLLVVGCGRAPSVAETPPRHIELEGEHNFRDVGGYETADGRVVKWRQVFRSGDLSHLTDADREVLADLGLKTVVNFLTPEEIHATGGDKLPASTSSDLQPIEGKQAGELANEAQRAIKTADFAKIPVSLNTDIHKLLLDDGKEEYAAFLRAAMDPAKRPLSFHCSHGIHRTGTATALLLSALGVPWETIREDYVLSNTYRAKEIDAQLARIRTMAAKKQGIPEDAVDMTNVEAFFRIRPAYIDGVRDRAVELHGSIEAYLRKELGLTDADFARLQAELLESAAD